MRSGSPSRPPCRGSPTVSPGPERRDHPGGVNRPRPGRRRRLLAVQVVALAVQPAEEDGHRPGSWRSSWPAPLMKRSSAEPWASARTRASNGGTASSSLPWTTSSGRGARRRARHGPHLLELPRPGVERGRERRVGDHPDLAVLEQVAGMTGPVVEVARRPHRRHALDPGSRAAHTDSAPPVPNPASQTPRGRSSRWT